MQSMLEIITSPALTTRHGFFTRKGGASSGIFAGLNCGTGSSDQAEIVAINRTRVAEAMGVGDAMRLSPGEAKQGGRRREGVLGDAMEALLAAVWLDGGFDAVRTVFDTAWKDELSAPPQKSLTNPKSALQEWALGLGKPLPAYRIVERKGSDHAPTFTVEASVAGYPPLTAQGRSRQDAEKAAAIGLLQREGVI